MYIGILYHYEDFKSTYCQKLTMPVYIASDHAGVTRKRQICSYLKRHGINYVELGEDTHSTDDYVDFARMVGEHVVRLGGKGILICSTGLGMSIAANKIAGVRAVTPHCVMSARLSRSHNNSNVLALGAKTLTLAQSLRIVSVWLSTPFSKQVRHVRRLSKIKNLEVHS